MHDKLIHDNFGVNIEKVWLTATDDLPTLKVEAEKILAAAAKQEGVRVAPHNPSAASVQVSGVIENFQILEFQWGESLWRRDLVVPPERFTNGAISVPDGPGLGITLNETLLRRYRM